MKVRRFPSRAEAEGHLTAEGFEFVGAPSRWRRHDGEEVTYADVVTQGTGAVILYSEARDAT